MTTKEPSKVAASVNSQQAQYLPQLKPNKIPARRERVGTKPTLAVLLLVNRQLPGQGELVFFKDMVLGR